MKKFLILFLLLGFITCISYSDEINMKIIVQEIEIISPDGDVVKYTDPEKVPNIRYSSKIIAKGMAILNYHSIGIVLKNQQGLFIAKDPINNTIMFSKVENTRSGPIVVTFDASTILQMDADTIFSLKYEEKDNSITMKIIDGYAKMKMDDGDVELLEGETFKYIIKGLNYAV